MKSLIFIGISITLLLGENLTSPVDQPEDTARENPTSAIGQQNNDTGENSTSAIGQQNNDTGENSTSAIGQQNNDTGENSTSAVDQPNDTTDSPSLPALTCVVIGDVACDRMCKMIGHIYASPVNQASCNTHNNCECSIRAHKFLDDLWKDKFSPMEVLETIKTNEQQKNDILSVLQTPFRTREQTKNDLQWFLHPTDFEKVKVNDNVSENMIKNNGKGGFDHDNIRSYINRSLQSDPLQLPADFDFKARFRNVLENTENKEYVQNIIDDVRRSKNAVLNKLVDDFISKNNIQQDNDDNDEDDEDETLTDILDLMIVSEFITPSPITSDTATTSAATPQTIENNVASNQWDLDLPNLDVQSVQNFSEGYNCWSNENPQYRVCLFKSGIGEHQLWWKKAKDVVDISVQDTGEITQDWQFENGGKISLSRKSNGDVDQLWKFAPNRTQMMYIKSGNNVDEIWAHNNKDEDALTKYKALIDLWCDKNAMFIDRKSCVIY